MKLILKREEINPNPAKVGQAVYDIMSKPQEMQEVGETLDAMTPKYYEELFAAAENGKKKLDSPFYIVVLRKKESFALNVLRQWFVTRQTKPSPYVLRQDYPNHDHDVWCVDARVSSLTLEWVLPTEQDQNTILKNKELYHTDYVKWIVQYRECRL